MHHASFILLAVAVLAIAACSGGTIENPLLAEWDTPYGSPPFAAIETKHYLPAFDEAFSGHAQEIAAIAESPEEPSFQNTIAALDRSGQLLDRVRLIFVNLNESHTNDEMQELAKTINPMLAGHRDDILLNEALFARVKAVYDSRVGMGLTLEESRLLDKTYRRFVRGGADLDAESKARLRELNGELSVLTTQFGENLVREMNSIALLIEDEEDLAGLPQSVRDSARALAASHDHASGWAFNLQRTSWTPFLQLSERRDLREKLYTAYTELGTSTGNPTNTELASRIASLRVERAHILGYDTHAAYILEENMAERPASVNDLLAKLWSPALARAKAEKKELQDLANQLGDEVEIAMWDWWYYTEKLRAAKYDFDEEAVKPYLELETVRQAAFDTASKLWGLSFEAVSDIQVYHPDVLAFDVKDEDGSHLGLFFVDYFARESKRGGAWMENLRQQWRQNGQEIRPIVVNVCNFSKPSEGQPALLGLDEASTLFHEFGHALHGLLADGTFAGLSGTNVAWDFVELPSQMMENWAFSAEVLPTYARHYETGEPIPDELVEKLQLAKQFNQGFITTEYLAACILDMAWHTRTEATELDTESFENETMQSFGLIPEIVSRYRSPYFAHIFSGQYSAAYYSYVWAEVLDADGFEAFKQVGLFDKDLAASYRKHILEAGSSEPPMELYKKFRGAEPSIEPLLAKRGLL